MRRQTSSGFTLIELAIILAILMIASLPTMEMFDQVRRQYRRAIAISDLKNECAQMVSRLQTIASEGLRVDPDQRGATFSNGKLRWDDQTLTLIRQGQPPTTLNGVRHASLFRRDGRTFLTLEISTAGPRPQIYRTLSELEGDR